MQPLSFFFFKEFQKIVSVRNSAYIILKCAISWHSCHCLKPNVTYSKKKIKIRLTCFTCMYPEDIFIMFLVSFGMSRLSLFRISCSSSSIKPRSLPARENSVHFSHAIQSVNTDFRSHVGHIPIFSVYLSCFDLKACRRKKKQQQVKMSLNLYYSSPAVCVSKNTTRVVGKQMLDIWWSFYFITNKKSIHVVNRKETISLTGHSFCCLFLISVTWLIGVLCVIMD